RRQRRCDRDRDHRRGSGGGARPCWHWRSASGLCHRQETEPRDRRQEPQRHHEPIRPAQGRAASASPRIPPQHWLLLTTGREPRTKCLVKLSIIDKLLNRLEMRQCTTQYNPISGSPFRHAGEKGKICQENTMEPVLTTTTAGEMNDIGREPLSSRICNALL